MLRLVLVFLIAFLTSVIRTQSAKDDSEISMVLDAHNISGPVDSPANLSLGTTLVLACITSERTEKNYTLTWMCSDESCLQNGYAGRNITTFTDSTIGYVSVLAINITSEHDSGIYTCILSAREHLIQLESISQRKKFELNVIGGDVVHSYGRLILNEAVIYHRRQLQPWNDTKGDWMIKCRLSGEKAKFTYYGSNRNIGMINQTIHPTGSNATVVIEKTTLHYKKFAIEGKCGNLFHYLFLEKDAYCRNLNDSVKITPSNSSVTVTIDKLPCGIARAIVGYATWVQRVWVDVEYVNLRECESKTFLPVHGSCEKYRITVWGLSGGNVKERRRCRLPTIREYKFTSCQAPSQIRNLTGPVSVAGGMGLIWIPPRDPNGVITGYNVKCMMNKMEMSVNTTTNYFLLKKGQVYENITVTAMNAAGYGKESEMLKFVKVL